MACCPHGIFIPTIIDCSGNTRPIEPSERLRIGDALLGYELFHTTAGNVSVYRNSIIIADATLQPILIALPPAREGLEIIVKKVDSANPITINANGSETIDGTGSFILSTQYESVILVADQNKWHTAGGGGGGGGSVTPGTTDNAITRADGTGNDAIQGSTAILSDTGALTLNQDATLEASGAHAPTIDILDSVGATSLSILAYRSDSLNVAIGRSSGSEITTGISNIIVGLLCGTHLTTGNSNVVIGRESGRELISGSNNVILGVNALKQNLAGNNNFALGTSSMREGTTGSFNVGIGTSTLTFVTGSNNVAIGQSAGLLLTTAASNVFIGTDAGNTSTQLDSVTLSVGIGTGALTTGNNSTVVGAIGKAAANGTAIGRSANAGIDGVAIGFNVTAAANEVILGNTSVTQTQLRGNILVEDTHNFVFDTTTGSKIASTATEKIAFWGATPIVQPAAAGQAALTNSTGGTTDGVLAAIGDTTAVNQGPAINDNLTEIHTLLNEIRTALVSAGLIKGAA